MSYERYPTVLTINEFLKLFTSGAKSVGSIKRKFFQFNENQPIGEVNDLVRATVVMTSYEITPSLLINLHSFLDNFKGYITIKNSGYTGIHAQFLFQGFRAEIQFTTSDALVAKKHDDERYHNLQDALFKSITLQQKNNLTKEEETYLFDINSQIDNLINQETFSRKLFNEAYKKNGLYNNLSQIESLLHLYSAMSKPIYKYENPLLNLTEKSEELIQEVANQANIIQFNMENSFIEELHEFTPSEIVLPDELQHFSECDNLLKSITKEFSTNGVSNKKLTQIKDDILHDYIRQSLASGNYDIKKLQNKMENTLTNLSKQEEKQ